MTPDEMDAVMERVATKHQKTWQDNPKHSAFSNALASYDAQTTAQVKALIEAGVTDQDLDNYNTERGRLGDPVPRKDQS